MRTLKIYRYPSRYRALYAVSHIYHIFQILVDTPAEKKEARTFLRESVNEEYEVKTVVTHCHTPHNHTFERQENALTSG